MTPGKDIDMNIILHSHTRLTDQHASHSYGGPLVLLRDGSPYEPTDLMDEGCMLDYGPALGLDWPLTAERTGPGPRCSKRRRSNE